MAINDSFADTQNEIGRNEAAAEAWQDAECGHDDPAWHLHRKEYDALRWATAAGDPALARWFALAMHTAYQKGLGDMY